MAYVSWLTKMPALKRARQSRSHTMGGCATCRRRHVKCDQVKPQCLTCRAIGITCGGFSYGLRWMPSAAETVQDVPDAGRMPAEGTRRHLYTGVLSEPSTWTELILHRTIDAANEYCIGIKSGCELGRCVVI